MTQHEHDPLTAMVEELKARVEETRSNLDRLTPHQVTPPPLLLRGLLTAYNNSLQIVAEALDELRERGGAS